jgi:alkylation response protein AidB-like acyl-CoA dehydrogenase
MGWFKINRNDIFFVLKEQLGYGSLCRLERYRDLSESMLDQVVTEAMNFAGGILDPLQEIGEAWGVRFESGKVTCPPEFKKAFQKYGREGWLSAARDLEYGGQGLPHMMRIVINDFMYGACQAFNMCPSLTHGAAHLIESFGTPALKELFVPRMYEGTWSGTMCLTEPDAGSNLGAIRAAAVKEGEHYRIQGEKIFISWGDHDLTENIIHLVLARIDGAPDGVKGISLFVVPKVRVNPDGSAGESNDVVCQRVEEKMGLHASPTCELIFGGRDGCVGYLCGEANKGLSHMFQMMNAARINAAVSGMTIGSLAYQNALAYVKARRQGRDLTGQTPGDVPIIRHPDVRRMLLWMKATVDGMRSMVYSTAYFSDLAWELPEGEEKAHYQGLLDFLTPIVKAYCSEMGFRVCENAIQCLGGYGYTRDYPLEQYLRDVKIMSLYEGTNGIQAMDLMGRKMTIQNGTPFRAFLEAIRRFLKMETENDDLKKAMDRLSRALVAVEKAVPVIIERLKSDPLVWGANAYPGLLCFGELTMAWRLLDMAVKADRIIREKGKTHPFYSGKIMQATYFVDTTLPITLARLENCIHGGGEIIAFDDAAF